MKTHQNSTLSDLQEIVGEEYAFSPVKNHAEWLKATYLTSARPMMVVRPMSTVEIIKIIDFCNRNQVTFETISLGYNWGYGSRTPSSNNCIQISLDRMKKIQVDESSNSVLIESGVSQAELCNYLRDSDSDCTMSVSGSSPHSSILGNALTGGYGNGIHTVRWDNLISLTIINRLGHLQEIFRTDQDWCGWRESIKNGTGGVVVSGVFELPEIPSYMEMYFFSISSHTQKTRLIESLIKSKELQLIDGNWSCFPDYRIIAEYAKLRNTITDTNECISRKVLKDHYDSLPEEWRGSLAGVFCKQSATLEDMKRSSIKIRAEFESIQVKFQSYLLDKQCIKSLRVDVNHDIGQPLHDLVRGRILTFSGIVRNGSIPMSYWRKKTYPNTSLHLDRDDCGFIWLACTSSATPELLSKGIEIIEATFSSHGLEPLYVIDGISNHEIYTMVAIIFDKESESEYQSAIGCFRACRKSLNEIGIQTYRDPLEI
jgi:4-cresol dehydrogenase (hydroxylating) flavoprotein subunit